MTVVSQILPAAKAVNDAVFNLSEELSSKTEIIQALHELQKHLQDFNFARQPPLDNILLYEWTFSSLNDLRNRCLHHSAYHWLIPELNALLTICDDFLETAHLIADRELVNAFREIKSDNYNNYDDILDLDAL